MLRPLKWIMAPSVQTEPSTSITTVSHTAAMKATQEVGVAHGLVPKVGRSLLLLQHVSVSLSLCISTGYWLFFRKIPRFAKSKLSLKARLCKLPLKNSDCQAQVGLYDRNRTAHGVIG